MAKYPDRRSAAIPALHAAQERARLVLARGDRAGRRGDAADARLSDVGGDLLRHARDCTPAPHTTSTCARTSLARCWAPTSSSRRCGGRRGRPRRQRALVRVPGRVRHRADGLGQRRVRRARWRPGREQIVEDMRAGRAVLQHKQLRYRRCVDPAVAGGADEFGCPTIRAAPTPRGSAPRTSSPTGRAVELRRECPDLPPENDSSQTRRRPD